MSVSVVVIDLAGGSYFADEDVGEGVAYATVRSCHDCYWHYIIYYLTSKAICCCKKAHQLTCAHLPLSQLGRSDVIRMEMHQHCKSVLALSLMHLASDLATVAQCCLFIGCSKY